MESDPNFLAQEPGLSSAAILRLGLMLGETPLRGGVSTFSTASHVAEVASGLGS